MSYFIHLTYLVGDITINIPEQSPTWLVFLFAGIAIIIGVIALVLKYSSNAILLKSKVDEWRSDQSERHEQKEMADDLEDKYSTSQKEINKDAGFNVLPFNMKIKWQKRDDVKSIYRGGDDYWIVMHNEDDVTQNFVRYIEACVEKNLVSRTRRYIPMNVRRAIELTMIKKILRIELDESLDYFDENIYKPDINKHESLNTNVEGLTDLDAKGLFVRAFLRELHDYGNRLFPKTASNINRDDMKFLTYFFAALGKKRDGDKIQTIFKGKTISVGVVFVAGVEDRKNLDSLILNPLNSDYATTINDYLNQNIESIYLLARGGNIKLVEALLDVFNKEKNPKIDKTYLIPFKDREKNADAIVGLIRLRKVHS